MIIKKAIWSYNPVPSFFLYRGMSYTLYQGTENWIFVRASSSYKEIRNDEVCNATLSISSPLELLVITGFAAGELKRLMGKEGDSYWFFEGTWRIGE